MRLDQVKVETLVKIKTLSGEKPIKRRLMDLGLLPGTELYIIRTAPLGDPIEIKIKDSILSIRKQDARHIITE